MIRISIATLLLFSATCCNSQIIGRADTVQTIATGCPSSTPLDAEFEVFVPPLLVGLVGSEASIAPKTARIGSDIFTASVPGQLAAKSGSIAVTSGIVGGKAKVLLSGTTADLCNSKPISLEYELEGAGTVLLVVDIKPGSKTESQISPAATERLQAFVVGKIEQGVDFYFAFSQPWLSSYLANLKRRDLICDLYCDRGRWHAEALALAAFLEAYPESLRKPGEAWPIAIEYAGAQKETWDYKYERNLWTLLRFYPSGDRDSFVELAHYFRDSSSNVNERLVLKAVRIRGTDAMKLSTMERK